MRHKHLKIIVLLWSGLGLAGLKAQEAIPATGGNASGSGGSQDYTVGQVFYQTNPGIGVSIAGGLQQPYEISVVTEIKEARGITLSISAYPNPATDYLLLEIDNDVAKGLSFRLYDMQGRLLQIDQIVSNRTRIDMKGLVDGTYFLKITQENIEVKTFKIIKQI